MHSLLNASNLKYDEDEFHLKSSLKAKIPSMNAFMMIKRKVFCFVAGTIMKWLAVEEFPSKYSAYTSLNLFFLKVM